MKVFIAHFTTESNAHITKTCSIKNYIYATGNEVIEKMRVGDIFASEGIGIIPGIYANAHANGVIEHDTFQYISEQILQLITKHIDEIDGIYLHLHGASSVAGLKGSSGEHALLHSVRLLVGKYVPIAVSMDPHGNVTEDFCRDANYVRCYRQSPHTDALETVRTTARALVDLLKNRNGDVHPVICKIPIMVGGERSCSLDEPMLSINAMMDRIEKDERVRSCSYHIGYLRHDDDKCGAAAIVVPMKAEDRAYCEERCREIADYAWEHRHEFHFTGKALEPDQAIDEALHVEAKLFFVNDSGDNPGAGATGYSTDLLRRFLKRKDLSPEKRILFSPLIDETALSALMKCEENSHLQIDLGAGEDELSALVPIDAQIIKKASQHYFLHETAHVGDAVLINILGTPIDLIIVGKAIPFCEIQQYEAAGVNLKDYAIVVNKQGYLEKELRDVSDGYVMALTDGPTMLRTELITYHRIMRPMYPIDNI